MAIGPGKIRSHSGGCWSVIWETRSGFESWRTGLGSKCRRRVTKSIQNAAAPQEHAGCVNRRAACGGLGIQWAERTDVSASSGRFIEQAWVPGRLFGGTMLCDGRRAWPVGVCRSLFTRSGSNPFVFAGSFGPVALPDKTLASLLRLADRTVRSTGLRGLMNIDFICPHVVHRRRDPMQDQRLWLLEINPRWSGSSEILDRWLQQRGDEVPLLERMVRCIRGMEPSLIEPPNQSDALFLKRIVYARKPCRFNWRKLELLLDRSRSEEVEFTLHDRPPCGTKIATGHPVCTLVCRFPSGANRSSLDHYRRVCKAIAGILRA